jgi:hypothetical protein
MTHLDGRMPYYFQERGYEELRLLFSKLKGKLVNMFQEIKDGLETQKELNGIHFKGLARDLDQSEGACIVDKSHA